MGNCYGINFFGPISASFVFNFRLFHATQINIIEKSVDVVLGTAGWKPQTNPLNYGGYGINLNGIILYGIGTNSPTDVDVIKLFLDEIWKI